MQSAPVPKVGKKKANGLGALFLFAGLPDSAFPQLEDTPEDDEH
jgi:hypothetical protein